MKKKILHLSIILVLTGPFLVKAQYAKTDSTYKKWYIGSSFLILANLVPDDNPPISPRIILGRPCTSFKRSSTLNSRNTGKEVSASMASI